MKYDIFDKKSAVMATQTLLLELFFAFEWADFVAIDGIYDAKTRAAVQKLQKRYGLEETGSVDRITQELLYDKYLEALNKNSKKMKHR